MISIENLSKNYGTKSVLGDISVKFEPGKVYGIVGKNGAGKTTFFECLTGLVNCKGRIKYPTANYTGRIGYLQTNPLFLSKITGKEYLSLLSRARNITPADLEHQNIFDLPLSKYAETYSTGMKKKLALTGLLVQKNDFFILDEPFNGVDLESNFLITEIILRLKALQKTVLVSSHIFATLENTCDIIHILEKGQISYPIPKEEFEGLTQVFNQEQIDQKLSKLEMFGAGSST